MPLTYRYVYVSGTYVHVGSEMVKYLCVSSACGAFRYAHTCIYIDVNIYVCNAPTYMLTWSVGAKRWCNVCLVRVSDLEHACVQICIYIRKAPTRM